MASLLVDRGWVFFAVNGEVYRAPEAAPIAVNGLPMAARWWGPMHTWRFCQTHGVYPFEAR